MRRVEIRELHSGGGEWTYLVRNAKTEEGEAIAAAIRRNFGKTARFEPNGDLGNLGRYGQIVKPVATGGMNCLTSQVRVEVIET